MRIALVTCALFPDLTDDDRLLASALRDRGAEVLVWDWRRPSPGPADLVVLRSPWDYPEHADAFGRWLDARAAEGRLVNDARAVRWNLHKGYLAELAGAGVPCVPTAVVPRGAAADLAALKRARGWTDVVVKPAVGGSSRDTVHEGRAGGAAAARHLRALARREDTVVQPFVAAVLARGELSLVYLGGRFSHAVRKTAAAGDWRVQSDFGGTTRAVEPAAAVRAAADAAVRAAPAGVYARVDVLEDGGGALVIEHELIDCELFLSTAPGAAERFAAVLIAESDRQPPG